MSVSVCECVSVSVCVVCVVWMGDGRLVGKGLHHTSLHIPCAVHMLKLSISLFLLFFCSFAYMESVTILRCEESCGMRTP